MASEGNGRSADLDSIITCKLAARRTVPRYGAHVISERFLTLPRGYPTPWSRSRSAASKWMRMILRMHLVIHWAKSKSLMYKDLTTT